MVSTRLIVTLLLVSIQVAMFLIAQQALGLSRYVKATHNSEVGWEVWVRELSHILGGRNILVFKPRASRLPSGWGVDLGESWVNVTCRSKGRGVVRLGEADITGGREYVFSALFQGWNGYVDIKGGPSAEVWVRWLSQGREELRRILTPSGSTPAPRRFTNITRAPEWAEKAELYLVVYVSPIGVEAWLYVETPFLAELSGEALWSRVNLTLSQAGSELEEYSGVWRELKFTLRVEGGGTWSKASLTVENLKKEGRALNIALVVPLDGEDWYLWIDPRTKLPLNGEMYSRTLNSLVSGGYLPTSLYPLAAVMKGNRTIGLAVPLNTPAICTFGYVPGMGFIVSYPVGLTGAGTKHARAELAAEMYVAEGGGMREVMALYVGRHEEWFTSSVEFPSEAGWELSRYGVAFFQGSFQYPAMARWAAENLKGKGVYLAQYILPWEYEPVTGVPVDSPPPSYWYVMSRVKTASAEKTSQGIKALASLYSTPVDENGYKVVASLLRGPGWRPEEWVPRIPMNTDPDLPGYNAWNYTVDILTSALSNAEKYGFTINGVELDNFMARGGTVDPREEAIEALDWNLVYDPNTFKPAVHLSYAAVEYLARLREWIDENIPGGGLTGNYVAEGYTSFGLPYLDALPFECSPDGFNWGDVELLYRRFAAGKKHVTGVATRSVVKKPEYVEEFIDTLLFYGMLPVLREENYADPQIMSTYGEKLAKAAEVYRQLYTAGWRPITKATSPNLLVERFGDWPTLYITVYNPHNEPKPLKVRVEVPVEQVSLTVVWGDVEAGISVGGGVAVITGGLLEPHRTAIFLLSSPSQKQGTSHSVDTRKPLISPKYIIILVIIVVSAIASIYLLLVHKKRGEGANPSPVTTPREA